MAESSGSPSFAVSNLILRKEQLEVQLCNYVVNLSRFCVVSSTEGNLWISQISINILSCVLVKIYEVLRSWSECGTHVLQSQPKLTGNFLETSFVKFD